MLLPSFVTHASQQVDSQSVVGVKQQCLVWGISSHCKAPGLTLDPLGGIHLVMV